MNVNQEKRVTLPVSVTSHWSTMSSLLELLRKDYPLMYKGCRPGDGIQSSQS